jgi:hypothetical protein
LPSPEVEVEVEAEEEEEEEEGATEEEDLTILTLEATCRRGAATAAATSMALEAVATTSGATGQRERFT